MMNSLYFKLGALASAFAGGFWLNGALWQGKWDARDKADALSFVAAQEAERAKERQWQDKLSKVTKDAKITQERLQIDSEQLASTVDSLRGAIKVSASKNQSANTAIADLRRAGATTELVQKELLGFVITRAEGLATAYDRSRAAGLTCESAYDSVRGSAGVGL